MLLRKPVIYLVFVGSLGSIRALQAQYVVTFSGVNFASVETSASTAVAVYESSTLAPIASFSAPGSFKLLSKADGTHHYLISNSSGPAITVVDHSFGNAQQVGDFLNPPNAAVLSPDGSRLVLATTPIPTSSGTTASVMYIFSTDSNTDLTPAGISVGDSTILDLVVSYDSQTAYALGTLEGNSYLVAISLVQNTVTATLNINGPASSLALGPNGLLYVGAPGKILEVSPTSFTTTPGGVTNIDATPGRLVFTPDGHYGLAVNQTPDTGLAVVLLDLTTHTVAGTVPNTGLSAPFDRLLVASNNIVYAFSSAAQSLYTLQIGSTGGIILEVPSVPGITFSAISAVGLSNDLGVPGRNFPQFLFVVSNGILYRIDPATSTMSQQVTLSSNPDSVAFWSPTVTGNTAATTLLYGDNQALSPGATSLPLVVRVLDANGLPISGIPVSFTVASGTVAPALAATGADGYAEAIFTAGKAPADIGAFTVNVGGASAVFTVNVGGGVGNLGGTGPIVLSIVSGQGQIVFVDPTMTNPATVIPFTVRVTDPNRNPVAYTPVTFAIASGVGALSSPDGSSQKVTELLTDSSGQASSTFVPPLSVGYPGFAQATVTASAGDVTVNYYITAVQLDVQSCETPPCITYLKALSFQVIKPSPGTVLSGPAGSVLTGAVQVRAFSSLYNVPVPHVALQVNTGPDLTLPNTSCADPTGAGVALTDDSGIATCDLVLNGVSGTEQLKFMIGPGQFAAGYGLTITPATPGAVKILSGNDQIGTTGAALAQPFVVQVTDANQNPVQRTPVSWQVLTGSMTLTRVATITDSNGRASASGTLTGTRGTVTMRVTAGSASATFTAIVSVPAAAMAVVSGDAQSAPIYGTFSAPLVVQLMDANGNPASFATVTFSVNSGSATLSSTSVAADETGRASTIVTAGATNGPVTIRAVSGNVAATFSLMVPPLGVGNITIVNGASFGPEIAPGGLATLTGEGLTPTVQGVITDSTKMAGYSVAVGTTAAPLLVLVNQNGFQQINIQVPFDVTPGPNSVLIETPQGSAVKYVQVSPLAPGVFTSGTVSTGGYAYPQAVALRADGSYVSVSNPAQRGETITFFATGLGQTLPFAATNVPGVPGQVVGGTLYAGVDQSSVAVISAVYQPNLIGVYAVTIQIPASTATGPAQLLRLYMVDAAGKGYPAANSYFPIK